MEEPIYENLKDLGPLQYEMSMPCEDGITDCSSDSVQKGTLANGSVTNGSCQISTHPAHKRKSWLSSINIVIGQENKAAAQKPKCPQYSSSVFLKINNVKSSASNIFPSSDERPNVSSDSDSDEGFKSSYAKSLLDSYKRSSLDSPQVFGQKSFAHNLAPVLDPSFVNSKPKPLTKRESVSSTAEEGKKTQSCEEVVNGLHEDGYPKGNNDIQETTLYVRNLKKEIGQLHAKLEAKERELLQASDKLLSLQMECSRLRAENRNLRQSQVILTKSLGRTNGTSFSVSNEESPFSSLTSTSSSQDVWMLQQQIHSLTSQLDKAEVSRHAYEAATRQLIHLLGNISSTLGSNTHMDSTANILNLSNGLLKVTGLDSDVPQVPQLEAQHHPRRKGDRHNIPNASAVSKGARTASPTSISPDALKVQENPLVSSTEVPSSPTRDERVGTLGGSPRVSLTARHISFSGESPPRRFSMPRKLLNRKSGSLLTRSGSYNNIATKDSPPRVSRSASTHCVASLRVEQDPLPGKGSPDIPPLKPLTSRARDFFLSIRNLLKVEVSSKEKIKDCGKVNASPSFSKSQGPRSLFHKDAFKSKKKHCSLSPTRTDSKSKSDTQKTPHDSGVNNTVFYVTTESEAHCRSGLEESVHDCGHVTESDAVTENEHNSGLMASVSSSPDIPCLVVTPVEDTEDELCIEVEIHKPPTGIGDGLPLGSTAKEEESTFDGSDMSGPQELSVQLTLDQLDKGNLGSNISNAQPQGSSGGVNQSTSISGSGKTVTTSSGDSMTSGEKRPPTPAAAGCTVPHSPLDRSSVVLGNGDFCGSFSLPRSALGDWLHMGKHISPDFTVSSPYNLHSRCMKGSCFGGGNQCASDSPVGVLTKDFNVVLWQLSRSTYRSPKQRLMWV